jgi:Kef-type K+ transport system membrane component KefB/nucleotide-binding universal stress UspA family protein
VTPLLAAQSGAITAPLSESEILVFLVQLLLLVGAARIFGWAFRRMGQPAVVGELAAGIALGPSIFGRMAPDTFSSIFEVPAVNSVTFGLAWLGVIMLLVVIGFETNLSIIARFKTAALSSAAGALLIPLAVIVPLSFLVPDGFVGEGVDRAVFAGFFALSLSVAALPVVAKILLDLDLIRRNFAQVTLAAGMTMDSVGWLLLAALSGVALDGFQPGRLATSFLGLVVFIVFAVTVGRWILDRLYRMAMGGSMPTTAALSITLVAALAGGAITQALHLEAIIGAFVVGVVAAITRHQVPQVRSVLESATSAFFAPIFFAFSGLRVDVWLLESGAALAWTAGLIVVSIVAKLIGAAAGGWFGGIRGREALALGSGLSALGAVGIVVAIVGLNLGVVSETGYTVMVLAALTTSIVAPQLLKAVVRRWEVPHDEAERLEREALRASSEILGRRRILIPTRGGANSAYAARLVASVFPGAEVSVMVVDLAPTSWWQHLLHRGDGSGGDPGEVVAQLDDSRLIHRLSRDPAHAIAREAALGYELVVLGATETGEGTFSNLIDRIVARVQLPTIVVRFPPGGTAEAMPRDVLVPVTASRSTRAAEEFAYSLARAASGRVTALHVVNRPETEGERIQGQFDVFGLEAGRELVAASARFGRRLGVEVQTGVRVAPHAEEEIIRMANSGDHDLLVLGTNPRSFGDRPFFGHRVSYILERARIPVVVISLPTTRVPLQ